MGRNSPWDWLILGLDTSAAPEGGALKLQRNVLFVRTYLFGGSNGVIILADDAFEITNFVSVCVAEIETSSLLAIAGSR